jgi:hypothetical protein
VITPKSKEFNGKLTGKSLLLLVVLLLLVIITLLAMITLPVAIPLLLCLNRLIDNIYLSSRRSVPTRPSTILSLFIFPAVSSAT